MSFRLYPAIDVRGGRVVRLRQGDYAQETTYADDPFAVAMRYADAGARWLHLVDLDAARDGGYTLAPLLRRIAADGRLRVQTGGGVRDEAAVETMLSQGAARVVVGSLAVREPALMRSTMAEENKPPAAASQMVTVRPSPTPMRRSGRGRSSWKVPKKVGCRWPARMLATRWSMSTRIFRSSGSCVT